MLTLTSSVTAAVSAIVNVLVAFSIVSWTETQIGTINLAIVAIGALIHTWYNPAVKLFGKKA